MAQVAARASAGAKTDSDKLRIALPTPSTDLTQDTEWCVVERDGKWHEIRFHDYGKIYDQPGLYELLFYDVLGCDSPAFVCGRLMRALERDAVDPAGLRVLDLGAGNGIMGEMLANRGIGFIVGTDILAEAEAAATRDRPGVYAHYLVADMSDPTAEQRRQLSGYRFNGLTCVAALGFGDIPPECFRQAFNLVADDGWIAFTIREDFLSAADSSGFARLVGDAIKGGLLRPLDQQTYPHRRSTSGAELKYTAVIGIKIGDIPPQPSAR